MKIAPARADAFARKPGPAVRAVLVYGPDAGLVRERADLLAKSVVPDLQDPFLVAELTGDVLRQDPARLADEAAAMALTGGRRVVRVRDATDQIAEPVAHLLEGVPGDALVVIQAGDLGPRSALRRLAEGAETAAALACYADDAGSLDRVIQEMLAAESVTIAPEATAYLAAHLGADRGITRSELRKLAIHAGPAGRVTLADAEAVVGDSAALSLDGVVYAAADGDTAALDRALARCYQEGIGPVAVLRALSGHLMRLQAAAARVAAGEPADRAMKALRPPVFFKLADRFRRQLRLWGGARAGQALLLALEAEQACKRTGMPGTAICGRTLLQVAGLARQGARTGGQR